MPVEPIRILKEAIKAVPALKYALGVAGLVAVISIVVSFKVDYNIAVIGVIILIFFMFILVIFAHFAANTSKRFLNILASILASSFIVLMIATLILLFSSTFFSWPVDLKTKVFKIDEKSIDSSANLIDSLTNHTSPNKTFRFIDFVDKKLTQEIEKMTKLRYNFSQNVTYTIEFKPSKELRAGTKKGYFHFDGGTFVIQINGTKCYEFEELKLRPYSGGIGNPKDILERKIEQDMYEIIKERRNLIADAISGCLINGN